MKPMTADLDGDALYYYDAPETIALKAVNAIKNAISLDDKCELLVELTDITPSKLRNMSRRRRKIAVRKYGSACIGYNKRTGQLVSRCKIHHKNNTYVPVIHTAEEKVGEPFKNFLEEWSALIL